MRRKLLGDVLERSQAASGAIQQGHLEPEAFGYLEGAGHLGGGVPERFAKELQRQALAAKTIREVAGKDWRAFASILSAVLAEQAESP